MSTLEVVSEKENNVLSRREFVLNFKTGSGLITRPAAVEAIAAKLGVEKEKVKVISLRGEFGMRDLKATAYVYSDSKVVDRQLPKYLAIRQLSKEERKKAREAMKKPATPVPAKNA